MNPEQIDLARKLVACPEWRWAPGMLALAPEEGHRWRKTHRGWDGEPSGWCAGEALPFLAVPDLTDAATAGRLLAMLPPDTVVSGPCGDDDTWDVTPGAYSAGAMRREGRGATLGEACARALLVRWGAK